MNKKYVYESNTSLGSTINEINEFSIQQKTYNTKIHTVSQLKLVWSWRWYISDNSIIIIILIIT